MQLHAKYQMSRTTGSGGANFEQKLNVITHALLRDQGRQRGTYTCIYNHMLNVKCLGLLVKTIQTSNKNSM